MPALYHLSMDDYLSDDSRIITVSRRDISQSGHINLVKEKLKEFLINDDFNEEFFEKFKKQLFFVKVDFSDLNDYESLKNSLNLHTDRERINYLSTSPDFLELYVKLYMSGT